MRSGLSLEFHLRRAAYLLRAPLFYRRQLVFGCSTMRSYPRIYTCVYKARSGRAVGIVVDR